MRLRNILNLGTKELRSLLRDPMLLILIGYSFTFAIYAASTAMPETLQNAPIAVVDEDHSLLSRRITDAFLPPYFQRPHLINQAEMDTRMDAGLDTFAIDIPPDFEKHVLTARNPTIQLNVDATRMSQALAGAGYVESIIMSEINQFAVDHQIAVTAAPVDLNLRARFNPEFNKAGFSAVMELINQITLVAIVLSGAALIREREHGTVEHLLAMPITPFEIMMSKIWSMGIVVFITAALSLLIVAQQLLQAPLHGSIGLFLGGTAVHLFAATSLGIFLATVARSMPQFGLLLMLVLLPLQLLSGSTTPRESMPLGIQHLMQAAPTTHFVALSQAILYRGAGWPVVWPQFLSLALIGVVLFALALLRFRKTLTTMA